MLITALDYETTGLLPAGREFTNPAFPRAVSVAAVMFNERFTEVARVSTLIRPRGFRIPDDATRIHGITNERAQTEGIEQEHATDLTTQLFMRSDVVVAHNMDFDWYIYEGACHFAGRSPVVPKRACTMKSGQALTKKRPSLQNLFAFMFGTECEAYQRLFGNRTIHYAIDDAWAAGLCAVKMANEGHLRIT